MRSQEHRSLVFFAGYESVDRRWQTCGARVALMPGLRGLLNLLRTGKEENDSLFEQGWWTFCQGSISGTSCSSCDIHSCVVLGQRWLLQSRQGLDTDLLALRLAGLR